MEWWHILTQFYFVYSGDTERSEELGQQRWRVPIYTPPRSEMLMVFEEILLSPTKTLFNIKPVCKLILLSHGYVLIILH